VPSSVSTVFRVARRKDSTSSSRPVFASSRTNNARVKAPPKRGFRPPPPHALPRLRVGEAPGCTGPRSARAPSRCLRLAGRPVDRVAAAARCHLQPGADLPSALDERVDVRQSPLGELAQAAGQRVLPWSISSRRDTPAGARPAPPRRAAGVAHCPGRASCST
jgi:hypothetical protein